MDKDKPIRPNSTETSAEKLLVKNLDQDLSGFSKNNVKQNNKKITVNRTVAKIVFVFSLVIIVQLLILVGVVVWLTSNDVSLSITLLYNIFSEHFPTLIVNTGFQLKLVLFSERHRYLL